MTRDASRPVRQRVRIALRDLAYSPPVRGLARQVEDRPAAAGAIEKRGRGELLRRIASESLPAGQFYARLTILNWKKHRGADVRLLERGEVVYGNRIQAPPEGAPLEYRNIVVTSSDPADFTLDPPARYRLDISRGAFSTPEQDSYDQRYGVRRQDGLYSSVRGNTTSPTRLLVTFPGFPPANSRVSYAVSYLKALGDEDLADTLMVCFQDRYGVAGTYMVHDNAGQPLTGRITAAITALMQRHGIPEEDVLLFGASKGASIAAMTARCLPGARQVLVVPQMSLPYYLAKPVLRGGLFRDRALWEVEQPGILMRRHLAEGRRIDWFYSDSDESSNASVVEYARDAEGLTKHRIGGAHASVAKRSMPTVLSLLRSFAHGADGGDTGSAEPAGMPLEIVELTSSVRGDQVSHRVQFADDSVPAAANVYLEGMLGRTRFRQLLSPGRDRAARWTAPAQRTDPTLHPARFTRVVAFDGTPQVRAAAVPPVDAGAEPPVDPAGAAGAAGAVDVGGAGPVGRHPDSTPTPLTCDATEPRDYALLAAAGAPSARVRYLSSMVDPTGETVELVLVPSLEEAGSAVGGDWGLGAAGSGAGLGAAGPGGSVARFVMEALSPWHDLPQLMRRLAIACEVEQVRVIVTDSDITPDQIRDLEASGWPAVTVHDTRSA